MPARAGRFEALPAVASPLRDHVADRVWTAAAKPATDRSQDFDEDLSRPGRGEGAAQRLGALVGDRLAGDHVVQHGRHPPISLDLESLEIEKLSLGNLDVKRFDLE